MLAVYPILTLAPDEERFCGGGPTAAEVKR
jgi:hypothetical protein